MRKRARKFAQRRHARQVRHLVALTCRLQFRLLSLTDINNRGQHEQSFRRVNWIETDFDRNLGAVFAPAKEFPASAHGPSVCIAKVTTSISRVMRAESLGYKHLNGLANKFLASITKDGLCLRVN